MEKRSAAFPYGHGVRHDEKVVWADCPYPFFKTEFRKKNRASDALCGSFRHRRFVRMRISVQIPAAETMSG